MSNDQASRRDDARHRTPRFGARRTPRRLATVALALLGALVPLLGGSSAAGAAETTPSGVVFVGIPGLAWPDITAEDTPTMHELAGSDAAGSLTVRTVRSRTCTVDGWLTVGAGTRASDLADIDGDGENDRFCRQPPEPSPGDGDAVVPGWTTLREHQDENSYNTQLGMLGDRLAELGVCSTAVGPGAALALADSNGRVGSYEPAAGRVDRELMSRCPVTVIDLGGLPSPIPAVEEPTEQDREEAELTRRQVVRGIDQLVGEIVAGLPEDTTLMIAGLADSAPTPVPGPEEPSPIPSAGLRVALAAGPEVDGSSFGATWLTSSSTHWQGLVQLTDVAPTLIAYAGADDPAQGVAGRPWRSSVSHPATSEATISALVGVDRAAEIYRTQSGPFFQILGIGHLVVVAAALLLMRRRGSSSRSGTFRLIQVVALAAAAAPVASYLANMTRWWRYDQPNTVLWASIVVATLALTLIALAGPWRRRVYGPPGVVAGVTATVLAVDVASGSSLQQSSLLGLSPLVAGRFYGFGNIPFAIFVVASLVAAAALGQWLIDSGRSRRFAATAVGIVGLVAVVIDGAPQAGADVGGILAAIPGFAVLVLGTLGARVTVMRVVLAGLGAAVLFFLFAWVDWLRPPGSRTHFGGFFADVLSGDALTVILRKAEASIGTVTRWPVYGWLVPLAYLAIIWLTRSGGVNALRETVERWSLFRHLVWAALLSGAVGFAANDSGIIVPALLLTAGVPLAVTAVAAAQGTPPTYAPDRELVSRSGR